MGERARAAGGSWAAFALAIAYIVGLTVADAQDELEPLTAALLAGPFVASLVCSTRQTAVVAAVAVLAALVSVTFTANPGSAFHAVRILVVVLGSGIAALGARARIRAAVGRERLLLLADLAELSGRRHGLEDAADRMAARIVARLADVCVLDLATPTGPRRLAARTAQHAGPLPSRDLPPAPTAPDGPPVIRRLGRHDAPDDGLAALYAAGASTVVLAPIRSEGELVGTLTLGLGATPAQRVEAADLPFIQALAGRVGLVLDNAGLSAELAVAERRFETALDEMDAAVMIQRPGEGIVYANQASADALALPDPEAVIAATPEEIGRAWQSTREDGTPVTPDDYPSTQILRGTDPHPPPLITHGLHRATGAERWVRVRATPVLDRHGNVEMAVSVTEDITAIKRAELVQRVLARAGEVLHDSPSARQTLQALADLVVPQLADWCAVGLPGDAVMDTVAVAHHDPARIALAEEYERRWPTRIDGEGGAGDILRGGDSVLVERITDAMLTDFTSDPDQLAALRRIGMTSLVQVPICPPDGPPLGVLSLVQADSHRIFSQADLELAEELGRRAGVALENARLYRERSRIAATLQTSLLPPQLPDVPGYELASTYRAAGRATWVGGDFYDVVETPAGWMVIVGDVTGHGASAAALTAKARHTLRTAVVLTGDPIRALSMLNGQLCARDQVAMCSACIVVLAPSGEEPAVVSIACAGHPRPVRVRDGVAEEVGSWGTMLGAFTDTTFAVAGIDLEPGDTLLVYTDGVTDARGPDDRFGADRLVEVVAPARGARDAVRRLERALDEFSVAGDQADDTAVVAIHRRGGDEPDVPYGDPGDAAREIATVRAAYDAVARRDVDSVLRHAAEDIELHLRGTGERAGRAGPYRGADGVREWFADVDRIWDELVLHADDVRAAAGAVVVFGEIEGRRGDERVRRAVMWTWTLQDGRVTSVRANDLGPVRAE